MAFIETDWERYFTDTHEGLGTTYERFVLHRYFKRLSAAYAVERVLEVPSFGMTGVSGINSMWWAARGASVTVVDDNARRVNLIRRIWEQGALPVQLFCVETFGDLPLQDGAIDLSWNFSALGFLQNPDACLTEMARVTRRAIFICIPNDRNLARTLRVRANGTNSPVRSHPCHIEAVLNGLGWQAVERGFLDVPPWPDIAMKKEDFIQKIGLGRFLRRTDPSRVKRLCILDYFSGLEPGMESNILRYSLLEGAPALLKMLWAHHRYLLFAPRSTPG